MRTLRDASSKSEKEIIEEALRKKDNKTQATELLRIHRTNLYKKMKKPKIVTDSDE